MTSLMRYQIRNRDIQDASERHVYSEISYEGAAGGIIKVKGTGTQDEELNLIRIGGAWVHPKKGADIEVFTLAGGSDTAQKHAMVDIHHDKYHKTLENTSGTQSAFDPDNRLEFNPYHTWLSEVAQAVGKKGNFEVEKDGDTVWIRGKRIFSEVPIVVATKPFRPYTGG